MTLGLGDDDSLLPSFGCGTVLGVAGVLYGAHMVAFPKPHMRFYYRRRGIAEEDLEEHLTTGRTVYMMICGLGVVALGVGAIVRTVLAGPDGD